MSLDEAVPALPRDDSSSDEFQLISVTNLSPRPQTPSSGNKGEQEVENCEEPHESESSSTPLPVSPTHELTQPKIQQSGDVTTAVSSSSTGSVHNALTKTQFENLRQWILTTADMEEKLGKSLPDTIRSNRNFNNPATYKKMIDFCHIDPFGSHIQSRRPLQENDYYEAIDEKQQNQTRAQSNPKSESTATKEKEDNPNALFLRFPVSNKQVASPKE